jgi:hypothetical protein
VYAPNSRRCVGTSFSKVEPRVHRIREGDGCICVVIDRAMDGNKLRQGCQEQGLLDKQVLLGAGEVSLNVGEVPVDNTANWLQFERSLAARRSLGRQETTLRTAPHN